MSDKTMIKGIVKKGEYYDSVSLMKIAQKLRELPDVADSAVVMASHENKAILEAAGMMIDEFYQTGENDLLIAISCRDRQIADRILETVDELLGSLRTHDTIASGILPRTIPEALKIIPEANLALISVAGKYAGDQAMIALQAGLHVMLFSDNVPLEKEIGLKKYAAQKNLLLMGPDCGTAIINSIPLGFANAINRGNIGIAAASGTGLQEVSCIISNEGAGISQAIGTGGRDISAAVGGIMFIEAIKALAANPYTQALLLISKPPYPDVLSKIASVLSNITKPIIAVFLGADIEQLQKLDLHAATSLEEGALMAVAISRNESFTNVAERLRDRDIQLAKNAKLESGKFKNGQRYLRGLFSGGTFCYESQVLLSDVLPDIYSNAPWGKNHKLASPLKSEKHTLIDMGDDEFTVGRLHPMIDYSLRNKRILDEANDQETAVILLDLVLGYGVIENPLQEIIPIIKDAQRIAKTKNRYLPIICSVTGTDKDPQNRQAVINGLREAGVLVMETNASACKLAGLIIKDLAK